MVMARSPPTTPPAMAPALVEDAGVEFGVGFAMASALVEDAGVEFGVGIRIVVDVVVLEEVAVLEGCRGNSIELRVVARLVELGVATAGTIAVVAVEAVARLVMAVAVVVTSVPTISYPFIEQ